MAPIAPIRRASHGRAREQIAEQSIKDKDLITSFFTGRGSPVYLQKC